MVIADLDKHLERIVALFKKSHETATWKTILIAEDKSVEYRAKGDEFVIARKELFTPEEYADKFDWLLDQGHSWIHLHVAGVFEGNLMVVVYFPNYPNIAPRNRVSINFSHISSQSGWNLMEKVRIID